MINNSGVSPYLSPLEIQREKLQERLASGKAVNSAADNAAGMAVITEFAKQILEKDQGFRNASDGLSLGQVADGYAENTQSTLQRMRELAVQASNGTLNDAQRSAINEEYQQLAQSIDQGAKSADFNGIKIADGSQNQVNVALGADNTESVALADLTTGGLGLAGTALDNPTNVASALSALDTALGQTNDYRAQLGASQNGLLAAQDNLQQSRINAQASRSQIEDTDYARAMANFTAAGIREQAAIAMQAVGQHSRAQVMSLISG